MFIVTKLWSDDILYDNIEKSLLTSLKNLGVEYLDLWLMHFPVKDVRVKAWKVMEKMYTDGKCKAIGVCNFTIEHLEELLKEAKVVPVVNQVEFSPYLY